MAVLLCLLAVAGLLGLTACMLASRVDQQMEEHEEHGRLD